MKCGYDIFGKAYGVMLRNDLHSPRSIDHYFSKTMILLDDDSYHNLYRATYCQTDMAEHEIYDFSQQFKRKTDSDTIDAVLEYTSSIAKNHDVPFEEMLFGGTEKQIIERGTDWCADMARVCCVILKCLNIPCRLLHIVDTNKAYNGHVVCEAFYENEYGVIDPIYGFRFYKENPISGYYLLKKHNEFSLGYDGYMDLYSAIAINEYDPLCKDNDYTVTSPNEYCLRIINTEHNDKWFMGEDKMTFLETERLVLRNVRAADAVVIYDYRNNEVCAKYQRGQTKDYEGIVELVSKRENDIIGVDAPFMVAVALKDTDEMVGEIVVMPEKGTISLGYTFSYRHHRKGYAYESLSALINLLHERYPDWDFISFTEPENIPSMNLLTKLEYKNMGYIPNMESQVFGKWTTYETEQEIACVVQK